MIDSALSISLVFPAVTFAGGGAALLGTRSRAAGILMLITGAGVLAGVAADLSGGDAGAQRVLVGTMMLPGAAAALAYPRLSFRNSIDFCLWVVVLASGVLSAALEFESSKLGTLASISAIAVTGHGWAVIETGSEEDREATLWLTLAALTAGVVSSLLVLEFHASGAIAGAALLSGVGPVMVIGVRRPKLFDVRSLVVQTVVAGVVAIAYITAFISAVEAIALAGTTSPSPGVLAFFGVLLAAGIQPLRVMLRGLIDELLFGERTDPLLAATLVTDRIGDDPLLALRAIREALMLPYASIFEGGAELASSGVPVTDTRRFPLALGNDEMGEIVVGLRPGSPMLARSDEQVLRIVAPLLAQTVRARRLSDDLRQSRAAAITAIEEERRRLRRDLHDGLGPTFSGLAFAADAARNSIVTDPEGADALLRRLRSDAVAAVAEIRRLVYDMRPPALDELGLVPALRNAVRSLEPSRGQPMHIRVEAGELPPLPAAVEVAAFRIASEAVMNSVRHSGADEASVEIEHRDGSIEVSVRDTGRATKEWVPGVGISSMRERAAEVGGTVQVTKDASGTLVRAVLPLP